MQHDGNGWVRCGRGHRHWGRFGAAGLLLADLRPSAEPAILLQHRAEWTANGNTWGLPGGARDSHESSVAAALRETAEETGVPAGAAEILGELVDDHGGSWAYTTVIAELTRSVQLHPQAESQELRWVGLGDVHLLELHPGFAGTWPKLRERLIRAAADRATRPPSASGSARPWRRSFDEGTGVRPPARSW